MLVFVPLTADELSGWARTGLLMPDQAFAVTPTMRACFGFAEADDEEAEHTALHIAGLACLRRAERRLVAVAETTPRPVVGSEFGEVRVAELPWSAVHALFAEDAPQPALRLHERLGAQGLDTAWEDAEVETFLADHELLWHGPGEWSALV